MKEKLQKLKDFLKDKDGRKKYVKWLMVNTQPYKGQILWLLLLNILLSGIGVSITIVNKHLIDRASSGAGYFDIQLMLLAVGITLLNMGVNAVFYLFSTLLGERYIFGVRMKIYESVMKSKWDHIAKYHSGDMVTRLTGDVDTIASGMTSIIPNICYLLVRLVLAFCVLFYYDHFLAIAALVLGPLGALIGLCFSGRLREYQKKLKENESAFRGFMQESVSHVVVVKSFGQEEAFGEKLAEFRKERLGFLWKHSTLTVGIRLGINLVFSGGYLLAFAWSIYRLSSGAITYGTMSVFLSLASQVQSPIYSLSNLVGPLFGMFVSVKRIIEIDEIPLESYEVNSTLTGKVGIQMKDVDFSYDRETVIEQGNMVITPGTIVGLVGESGAGKTSIARLLLALVNPAKGQVLFVDEQGNSAQASAATRKWLSYVPQGNTLISGTIRENLKMGKENATDDELWQAIRVADAEDFMKGLPDGLDTMMTERGGVLSEGQAQRLSIARAVVKNAPVLILDEATSALDIKTEERIVKNLKQYAKGITCLIITHRVSLLELCQQTYCIRDKQVSKYE